MTKNSKFTIIAVIIVIASFYAGMKYGQIGNNSQFPGINGSRTARSGMMGATGGMKGSSTAGLTIGEILSTDGKSITVKLGNGGSKIVFLSDTTQVMKSTTGALTDLAVGQQVMITGKSNPEGTLNAQTIQIRPAQLAGQLPGQQTQAQSTQKKTTSDNQDALANGMPPVDGGTPPPDAPPAN